MNFNELMNQKQASESNNDDNTTLKKRPRDDDDDGQEANDGHDAFISASELLERKKQKNMHDMYQQKIEGVISRFRKDAVQVATEFDFQGNDCVLVQQKGATGNWPGSFETLPMRAKWLDLHSDGTLGGKFAQDKKDAKYRIVLECGTAGLLDAPYAAITDKAQGEFCERVGQISDEVFWTMLKHPNILKEKTKKFVDKKKKSNKDFSLETFDRDVLDDWKDNVLSVPIKASTSSSGTMLISLDVKAFKRNYKTGSDELERRPVPIYDRKGKHLNAEDQDKQYIKSGDLVKCKFKFTTYTLPSGLFGTKFELQQVTLMKEGPETSAMGDDYSGFDDVFA